MTTLTLRTAVATVGAELPQPYVCEDLDATLRLDADVYVGCGVLTERHQQAWWRKMREAGLETYHRHDDAPISTRFPVVHPWSATIRLDVDPAVQVLGPRFSSRRLERSRAHGVTSIVAGELGARLPAYHPDQLVVAHVGTVGIVVVPARGIEVGVTSELAVAGSELHVGAPALAADLTIRAGRAYAAAQDAAPRLLRLVDHGARAAR